MNKILIIFILGLFGLLNKKSEQSSLNELDKEQLKDNNNSFEKQLETFVNLGYKLNDEITKEDILKSARESFDFDGNSEKYFEQKPFERLYYHLGWLKVDGVRKYFTDNCIWYDLEFIDSSSEYITFMKRMGDITHGEISYTDIKLKVDINDYEWIDFKVNGISKSWKLAKVRYVDDSFFQRFSYLPKELKTKGKYTYFDDGGQQFVIDYATENEQKDFIQKTGLQREWLGEGNHFSEHDPKK
jgi:hypothetical protein